MGQFAWVTLATNDSYALGSLVLAHSLKKVNTVHQLAVLVTPGVTAAMKDKLRATFNFVQEVNVLDSKDAGHLALLQRPELGVTFTKLHCWRLTQFEKCVFLDADTYVLKNCDELFEREELSAAPDVGWPDCFNSGVFVFRPNTQTFEKLTQFAVAKGSFDGGDQGLLNSYFSDWSKGDNSRRLPFIYNTCSTACYSYLPAFKQFGSDVKILHFIGQLKPWLISFDPLTRQANAPADYQHLTEYLALWWTTFCNEVHPKLTIEMGGLAGALANLKLGTPRTAEQEAYEDSCRRNYWEHGSIDYLGTTNTLIQQRIIKEVVNGRTVEKKIISYPGEQNEEIEEWETTQVGDETTESHTKKPGQRKIVPLPQQSKKPSPAAEAALKALVNTEVIVVPGHTKVEYDAETNTKTVTEKTTTGHQVTITTVAEDGKMKIQTKTYYDPIAIPCDEEEEEEEETYEETYEEEEPSKTTRKTTDNQSQKQTTQNQSVVDKQQQNVKNTNVNTVDQSKKTSNVSQVSQQQRISTETTRTTQTQQTQSQRQVQTSVQNQSQRNDQLVQQNIDQTDLQVAVHEPRHTVVKKKLETGEEIEVHTHISEDGRTKTRRRVVTKPAEEIEITEIEQTSTYEPGEVKFTTTSKTFPTQTTETRHITQTQTKTTQQQQQQQQKYQQQIQQQQQQHQQEIQQQQNKTQTHTKQTDSQRQNKNQNTTVAEQSDKNKNLNDYLTAHHEVRRTSVTETTTMIVQGQTETATKQQTKQTVTKGENVSLKQHGVNVSNTKNQQQTITSQHESVDKNQQQQQQQQYLENLTKNQQTNVKNQHHQSIDQSTTQQQQNTQNVTRNQQTTTQNQQKQHQSTQEQLTQQQRKQQQIDEETRILRQQQNKNVDKRFTAHQHETIRTEKHVLKTGEQTTITTTSGHVVTRPETLPGEETTEEVRYFPGGVEYIWRTVRKDGSSKMSSRTFYDPIPVPAGEIEGEDGASGNRNY